MITRCASVCLRTSWRRPGTASPDLLLILDDLPQIHALIHELKKDTTIGEVPVVVALPQFLRHCRGLGPGGGGRRVPVAAL